MKKRATALAMTLTLAISAFTGIGSTAVLAEEKTDGFKIGMCTANFGNTWCAQFVEDFESRAEEYKEEGLLADYQIATVSADLTDQINQCNAMINSGIDALLIWCVSPTGVKPIVDLAQANDVLVIISNEAAAYEGTYAIIGNNYGFQHILTEWLAEELEGTGNIVEITGVDGFDGNTQRLQAVDDVLADYPDINRMASAPGNWSATDAQEVMTTFLSTYNNIDGVLAQDVMGDGILKAFENAEVTPSVLTGDYTKSFLKSWSEIEEMQSCTVSYDPGIIITCLDVAMNLLQGKTLKEEILEPNPLNENLINTVMVDPVYCVTREGEQDVKWLEDYPNTKAITLEEALELLKDFEDTAALDGWLDREVVEGWFD